MSKSFFRNVTFDVATRDTLAKKIMKFKAPASANVPRVNALIFGPAGSGKSSFMNTVDSIFQGRISRLVEAGTATVSLTRELRKQCICEMWKGMCLKVGG